MVKDFVLVVTSSCTDESVQTDDSVVSSVVPSKHFMTHQQQQANLSQNMKLYKLDTMKQTSIKRNGTKKKILHVISIVDDSQCHQNHLYCMVVQLNSIFTVAEEKLTTLKYHFVLNINRV